MVLLTIQLMLPEFRPPGFHRICARWGILLQQGVALCTALLSVWNHETRLAALGCGKGHFYSAAEPGVINLVDCNSDKLFGFDIRVVSIFLQKHKQDSMQAVLLVVTRPGSCRVKVVTLFTAEDPKTQRHRRRSFQNANASVVVPTFEFQEVSQVFDLVTGILILIHPTFRL